MTPAWVLTVLGLVVSIIGGGAFWYYMGQKEFHVALWVGFSSVTLLCFLVTMHIRNEIIQKEEAKPHASAAETARGQEKDKQPEKESSSSGGTGSAEQAQPAKDPNATRAEKEAEPFVGGGPPRKPEPFFKEVVRPATAFQIVFGSNTVVFALSELEKGIPFSRVISPSDNELPMRFYLEDGKLRVDMTLFDERGQAAVTVVKNDFTVNRLDWDRNYDDVSLEVVDRSLMPRIQIVRTGEYRIEINGVFFFSGGTIFASRNGIIINPVDVDWRTQVPRRFRYPSYQYPGALETIQETH